MSDKRLPYAVAIHAFKYSNAYGSSNLYGFFGPKQGRLWLQEHQKDNAISPFSFVSETFIRHE